MTNAVKHYASNQNGGGDDLVTRHAALVKRIAYHLMARLPSSVQVDDLMQAGMIGLIEAGRHYDPSQGASFETYAGIRIRGAMLDELRKGDWAPRSVHRRAREVAQAVQAIEKRHGRDARDQEVAEALGVTLDEYYRVVQDANAARIFSLDAAREDDDSAEDVADERPDPMALLQSGQFRGALAKAISGLPERERVALSLYYDEELNLKEIGAVLGVTESRISQLLGQAVTRLRARMLEWKQG